MATAMMAMMMTAMIAARRAMAIATMMMMMMMMMVTMMMMMMMMMVIMMMVMMMMVIIDFFLHRHMSIYRQEAQVKLEEQDAETTSVSLSNARRLSPRSRCPQQCQCPSPPP